MRTPLRLAATIAKFRVAQAARGKVGTLLLYRWTLQFGAGKLVAVTNEAGVSAKHNRKSHLKKQAEDRAQALRRAPFGSSPVVWLTGPTDLLEHSITPGLARWLQEAGRTVFVETDGAKLRRRIHEFRPDARLYMTIRFYGMAETHDARMQRPGAFVHAVEGIRAAQLSGFLICAHVVIEAGSDLAEIERLFGELRALHVDGVVVTSQDDSTSPSQKKLLAARVLIGNTWWSKFSQLAQKAFDTTERSAVAEASREGGTAVLASNDSPMQIARETAASGGEVAAQ